ncbi:ribonuclease J [Candidatus Roizmanbacteria bacterium]|nr:ribonuclease J [Candidatus Roizmanbacteria bacterium]
MDNYKLHFIPLGGVVGVTKNMYVYELYKNDALQDIIIVDCGIGFPQEKELGVDFVIPDISYLKDKTDKIRALLFTHGHEDHIGAASYHYEALGKPQIYTSKLTTMFLEHKFKEAGRVPHMEVIKFGRDYTFGGFTVRFIPITHSIPDSMHILIKSPVGTTYHGPDFKLDLTPPYGLLPDFYEITKAGKEGVLALMSDALGADHPGLTASEKIVGQTFEDEMRGTKGKFIMTTFSSNISRIRQCVEAAIKFNRKIVFLGRSMKENSNTAHDIGYLPIPDQFLLKEEEVMQLPPNKVCIICAGSQGQYGSALFKLANNKNKNIKIKQGDKVLFSSDPIPGNENEVYALIEDLTLKGADVIYSDIADQLHASGHGSQEDLKFLMRFTNPKYCVPIGGTIRHQREYQKLAVDLGMEKNDVYMLDEGDTLWFSKNKVQTGEKVETKQIYVDAYGVGDVGSVVLRDRHTLSEEGIVVALLIIDNNGNLVSTPKILSRGFIFEQEGQGIFEEAGQKVESALLPRVGRLSDKSALKKEVGQIMEEFFFKARGRHPLIVVDVIQI